MAQKTKKTHKKNTQAIQTSLSKVADIDALEKEIKDIVDRFAGGNRDLTVFGDGKGSKGFFLMFLKRDNDAPADRRIEISTIGQFINLQELATCMDEVMDNLIEKSKVTNYA